MKIYGGDVRLCEVEVWDGGEWVYCHNPAVTRDAQMSWRCKEHDTMVTPKISPWEVES
jgi:hypothetical protein